MKTNLLADVQEPPIKGHLKMCQSPQLAPLIISEYEV